MKNNRLWLIETQDDWTGEWRAIYMYYSRELARKERERYFKNKKTSRIRKYVREEKIS